MIPYQTNCPASPKKIEVLLSDKDFGYIDQEEFNSKIKELSSEYSIIEK